MPWMVGECEQRQDYLDRRGVGKRVAAFLAGLHPDLPQLIDHRGERFVSSAKNANGAPWRLIGQFLDLPCNEFAVCFPMVVEGLVLLLHRPGVQTNVSA